MTIQELEQVEAIKAELKEARARLADRTREVKELIIENEELKAKLQKPYMSEN